jgi:TolB-like protein
MSCAAHESLRRNVIVLLDYSASTNSEQMKRFGRTISQDIIAQLRETDAVSVYPIDAGAVTRNTKIFDLDLRQHQFAQQSDFVTHASEEVKKRVTVFLTNAQDSVLHLIESERTVRGRFAGSTDILGALRGVTQYFEHPKKTGAISRAWNAFIGTPNSGVINVVVICSDMINESSALNFSASPPTASQAQTAVAKMLEAGNIPAFEGVVVFVTGRTGRNAEQVDGVHKFWLGYLREAHADLRAYDFDSGGQIRQFFSEVE